MNRASERAAATKSQWCLDLKSCRGTNPASLPETSSAPKKAKKGKAPSHELTRVLNIDGQKAYQSVAVLWLRENGNGFLKLKADLKVGDDVFIRPIKVGGAS